MYPTKINPHRTASRCVPVTIRPIEIRRKQLRIEVLHVEVCVHDSALDGYLVLLGRAERLAGLDSECREHPHHHHVARLHRLDGNGVVDVL